jgi:AcrR family transcriptional regulator
VRRAGIARNTFYDNFSSKEDCFLATQDFAVEESLRRVVDAAAEEEGWEARLAAGLGAFLKYVASEPALARTCIVEALSAGPAAVDRYERSIQAFVPLFRMGRKVSAKGEELPTTLEETIVGGIFWILYQRIIMGQAEQIEELLPELVEFSLTPYLGAESAKRIAGEEAPTPSAG